MRMYESRKQLGHVGPEHSGRLVMECFPFPPNYASLPLCEMSVNEKNRSGMHWFVG
jgi:hypothetical protein